MNSTFDLHGLVIVGKGASHIERLSDMRPSRRIPSLYADPLSWLVFEATEQAIETAQLDAASIKSEIGHLVISDSCTLWTMQNLSPQIADGRISPLRFSGANPGQTAGLSMMLLALHGPSLVLSMMPSDAIAPACVVIKHWLNGRQAKAAILSTHRVEVDGHYVSSLLFTSTGAKS